MPQLNLARTKSEHDASIGRTLQRRLANWFNGGFEILLKEAKALQQHAQKKACWLWGYEMLWLADDHRDNI